MLTQAAANKSALLHPWRPGLWRMRLPQGRVMLAGVTDRIGGFDALRAQLPSIRRFVLAEQVHGAGLTSIETPQPPLERIPGCDALTTSLPGAALVIQTADCLPLYVWDPGQQIAALAHVGWRGLAAQLPVRLVSFLGTRYQSRPERLRAAWGPAIRACCYEVGQEFDARFPAWIRHDGTRRTMDLIGCAAAQLRAAGIRAGRITDAGVCTACDSPGERRGVILSERSESKGDTARWHSVRRGAQPEERLLSFIAIRA
ncbi:MAG: polyphenol oxidase family protein [Candidatus Omnitrophica bacterium]|nr:polyphenol oxidase family protein [Candidatus Omnitrophota bacterium]